MEADWKGVTDSVPLILTRTSLHARARAQDGERRKVTLRTNREERHARGAGHNPAGVLDKSLRRDRQSVHSSSRPVSTAPEKAGNTYTDTNSSCKSGKIADGRQPCLKHCSIPVARCGAATSYLLPMKAS